MDKSYRDKMYILGLALLAAISSSSSRPLSLEELTSLEATELTDLVDYGAISGAARDKAQGVLDQYYAELDNLRQADYRTNNFWNDEDYVLLARHILGECEGCNREEKIAIAWNPINRFELYPSLYGVDNLKAAILAPVQYSAFNPGTRARILMDPMNYNPEEFVRDVYLARMILNADRDDPVYGDNSFGASQYYNPVQLPRGPFWESYFENIGHLQLGDGRPTIHKFSRPFAESSQ